eukprot:Sspe_Gene.66604::Locus_39343_Transcript_1_1_Confidence_1.000_Length_880::g.66604::m.66604/K07936/RAN; GTP-binding nuclear protein Ran
MTSRMTLKLVLVGDSGTGKSTFLRRHLTGEFEERHIPTQGVEEHTLAFYTTHGRVEFHVRDTGGREGESLAEDYIDADCAIIMFDVASPATYDNVRKWHQDVVQSRGDIPLVLVGNKVDLERKVRTTEVTYHRNYGDSMQYCELSAKSNYNFERPFLWLARRVANDRNLQLVDGCGCSPPPLPEWNSNMKTEAIAELEAIQQMELPDDDDEL